MKKLAYKFTLEEAYAFMGLPYGASPEEVKNKYRLLSVQHHPDLGGDVEMMKKLNRAKEVIDSGIGNKPISRSESTRPTRDYGGESRNDSSGPVAKGAARLKVEEYIKKGGLHNVRHLTRDVDLWGEYGQEDGLGYFIQVDVDYITLIRRSQAYWPRGMVAGSPIEVEFMEYVTPEIIENWIKHVLKYNIIFDRESD